MQPKKEFLKTVTRKNLVIKNDNPEQVKIFEETGSLVCGNQKCINPQRISDKLKGRTVIAKLKPNLAIELKMPSEQIVELEFINISNKCVRCGHKNFAYIEERVNSERIVYYK